MGLLNHNHETNKFTYTISKEAPYVKLRDLADEYADQNKSIRIRGMFTKPSKFGGEQATMICDEFYVNLPTHLVPTVKEVMNDDEAVKQINAGIAYFKIYSYDNSQGNKSYSIVFEVKNEGLDISSDDLPF